jgi:uracil-DNA glycosylase family 4
MDNVVTEQETTGADSLDLISQRRHPEAECERCPLNQPGVAFVPSAFPTQGKDAEFAVVGEAPGFQESVRGIPFIGPSGKLLNKVLAHHNIDRRNSLLTNVCLCRPEDNATPPKAAVAACRPRLISELQRSGAKTVIALGSTAAQVVLNTTSGVTKLRIGPPRDSPIFPETKVIATWHPAYCLRNADSFPDLVTDIAKAEFKNVVKWKAPGWVAYSDPEECLQVLEELEKVCPVGSPIVIDIECGIDKDDSFDHPNEYDMLCIGLGYEKGRVVVLGYEGMHDKGVLEALRNFLQRRKIVAQNGKFDLAGLFPLLGALELWFDTMLAHYALDERSGKHSLEYLGVELLGAPDWKGEIKKYLPKGGSYAQIPAAVLHRYNAYDISVTWDLYELFVAQLEAQGLRQVHDFMVAASNQLMFLELNGITIDKAYSNELERTYLGKLLVIEEELNEIVSRGSNGAYPSINPRSPKQVKEYLFIEGIQVPSTNQDTLERLLDKYLHPDTTAAEFCRTLLKHRRTQKLYGTYVKGIRKRLYRGRVYTTYLLHGTSSGRLASRNPNLQNIVRDKEIRGQFSVAKPGNIFIQADYKQAEGRVIADLAQDDYLRGIFADEDRDLFDELGTGLWGSLESARTKPHRVRTKAYFYGMSYGRTPYSVAMEYDVPVAQAEHGFSVFQGLIPATVAWQKDVIRRVHAGEDLITPFGRHRRFYLITKENQKDVENEALSYLPQSTASDICLSALVELRPALRGKAFIRLTIHDALVVECAEDQKDEVSELLREVMMAKGREYTDYVPFGVDLSYGTNWGQLS